MHLELSQIGQAAPTSSSDKALVGESQNTPMNKPQGISDDITLITTDTSSFKSKGSALSVSELLDKEILKGATDFVGLS